MISFAVCTYNRARQLPAVIRAMRAQDCDFPYEVLVINNNSSDDTQAVLEALAKEPGAPLRVVKESQQGIAYARNRALEEALGSDYMAFIDDDEIPNDSFLRAAFDALSREGADCVGGPVRVKFPGDQRPEWLVDELLPFLAETDYGDSAQWMGKQDSALWTANIAYRMEIFRNDSSLRFDCRYNRKGKGVGGGEDVLMYKRFLDMNLRIRYRPDMVVDHYIEEWRLTRRYFLQLHYANGKRKGCYEMPMSREGVLFGAPVYLYRQLLMHLINTLFAVVRADKNRLRIAMNLTHCAGLIAGQRRQACDSRST